MYHVSCIGIVQYFKSSKGRCSVSIYTYIIRKINKDDKNNGFQKVASSFEDIKLTTLLNLELISQPRVDQSRPQLNSLKHVAFMRC